MTHQITSPDGTQISRFAFGCMQFGGTADTLASQRMFEDCLAAGITHFDTAYAYTGGQSEEILGKLIVPHRDRLVVATKVGYVGGASARNMRTQFDESRRRLDMDHVDILYLHRFDPETELSETLECFAALKSEGKISHVGLSNFAAWQVVKASFMAQSLDMTIDVLQPMYSLVKRQAEVEILPMCSDLGILPATYSPLGGGLLTGKYSSKQVDGRLATDERYAARYGQEWMHDAASQLAEIAAELGTHPATLAVAWAAQHDSAPSPILSARNTDQLAPSLAALSLEMDRDLYNRLTELTPTPPPATDRLEEA
ncbi:aryl-alcohol dehydrogenase-like predicted oxidoreductase [Shimia isoporae]|uniref:Aryl-alcohol dehydrogenase-like predicted oxidoreductase n=1 Tax=Shimia isoporae TaxID=647720 RepID=A0A4V2Q214_9RHOB|nr:aldo/keto reductase [Shimia isoporae]TCL00384.1 aryl-alcohol dehydrogenase-like predicted oxidoreductase [Shimia isoporae]